MISDLMPRTSEFLVATDVSTDDFVNSHLDVRIQIAGRDISDNILLFYLLDITLSH